MPSDEIVIGALTLNLTPTPLQAWLPVSAFEIWRTAPDEGAAPNMVSASIDSSDTRNMVFIGLFPPTHTQL